jgi:23S rRNA (adenine2503-C2)-methyltransferase
MSNLAKDFRGEMAEHFTLARPEVVTEQISNDGTRKWLLRTGPGIEFETVYIPEKDRGTLCVSSQVGCTLNCRFCHTGTQKLVRNLTPDEIIGQLLVARDSLGDWPSTAPGRKVTNVVMMGMGEPLYNFDNVKSALAIVTDGDGLALSKRRVTLSTAGVVPMIEKAGAEIGSGLAISLHAVRDEVRNVIVPINRKYPIKELLAACRSYPGASNSRRITFEYVMLKGVNDTLTDARELVRLLAGIPAKINLIPFNPWPGAPYECSDWAQIEKFAEIVNRAGYASPVRTPRGRDIMAACGQLKSESVKERASARLAGEKLADMQSGQLSRMPS